MMSISLDPKICTYPQLSAAVSKMVRAKKSYDLKVRLLDGAKVIGLIAAVAAGVFASSVVAFGLTAVATVLLTNFAFSKIRSNFWATERAFFNAVEPLKKKFTMKNSGAIETVIKIGDEYYTLGNALRWGNWDGRDNLENVTDQVEKEWP